MAASPTILASSIAFAAGAVFALSCGEHAPPPAKAVEPAVRAGCVLLRAFMSDGELEEICATAEELAPLLFELLSERAERGPSASSSSRPDVGPSVPLLAVALDAPKKRVPKRRCAQWVPVTPKDASVDAPRDATVASEGP